MAKKRTRSRSRKPGFWKKTWVGFWLLWSMSGGILFSFGLLAVLNKEGTWTPVFLGGIMILFAIFTGKFTTETALAMRKRI